VSVFDTAVVIPTHPARGSAENPATLLGRAVASVRAQTVKPNHIEIVTDNIGAGAGLTRRLALAKALARDTRWVSFLDSDDTWYPNHLETHQHLVEVGYDGTGADVAYSWFDGNQIGHGEESWEITHRGRRFDPANPHHLTMTLTVRAELAAQVLDSQDIEPMHEEWTGEDWALILALRDLGARFCGTGEVTWTYFVHGGNTSGFPNRGDAVR
jgi:glycosyltransferase involved in cell wall biosynthesis